MLILEPCSLSKKHALWPEVQETFCSLKEFGMIKLKNSTGHNIGNFNIRVCFTLLKEILELILQLKIRFTIILSIMPSSHQFWKILCIITCNAVVWFSVVELDTVLRIKITQEALKSTLENMNMTLKLMSMLRTLSVKMVSLLTQWEEF